MNTLYWFNVIGGIHIGFMVLTIIFSITYIGGEFLIIKYQYK